MVVETSPAEYMLRHLVYHFAQDDCSPGNDARLWKIFITAANKHSEKFPLSNTKVPHRILVVCNENQGRSQIESAFLKQCAQEFGLNVVTRSAGVHATPYKYGGHPNPEVIAEMLRWGIDISDETVDQLHEADINDDTVLIVLSDPRELPPYAYSANIVISNYVVDPFPGEERPADLPSRLESLTETLSYMSFYIMLYLYESLRLSDITIFTGSMREHHSLDVLKGPGKN